MPDLNSGIQFGHILENKFQKKIINKSWSPGLIFFKKKRKIWLIFDTKKWLKIRILQSSMPEFKPGVDLTFYSKKGLFTIQLR